MYRIDRLPDRVSKKVISWRLVITGQDSVTVDLDRVQEPALAHITGNEAGKSFIVSGYDPKGRLLAPLVATIEPYEGVHPVDFVRVQHITRFEVKATGPWRIEIIPLAPHVVRARTLDVPSHRRGHGDDVFFLGGITPVKLTVVNCEDKYLAVETYDSRSGLWVNTIRQHQEAFDLALGANTLVVRSRGLWEIIISATDEASSASPEPGEGE